MKPSPYFADRFSFFFFRLYSKASLFQWFLKKADFQTDVFQYPTSLSGSLRTIVFLPYDQEFCTLLLSDLERYWLRENTVLVGPAKLTNDLNKFKTRFHFLSYTKTDCRYGESMFQFLEEKLIDFKADICLYLEKEPFLPRLYLAKKSGAPCRLGFFAEPYFPFLNVSLKPETDEPLSKVKALVSQYGGS